MELTDRRLRGLKPRSREYSESDSGPGGRRGLYVVVKPTGRKLFRARVTVDGKTQYKDLGDYPKPLSLAEARLEFDAQRRERRRRVTAQTIEGRRTTVKELLDEWERVYLKKHRKDPAAVRRAIDKDVIPGLGKVLVADVQRRDLVLAIDRVLERDSIRMADQLRSFVMQMFKFAVQRGLIDDSPALLLPKPKRGRHGETRARVLDDEELRRFWWAMATDDEADAVPERYRDLVLPRVLPYTKRCLRLLLLTGLRRSEAVLGLWSEIDSKANAWTIPAKRTKNGLAHELPLSDLALELLEAQRELTGAYPFIFASPRKEFATPIRPSAVSQAVNDNFARILGIDGRRRKETAAEFRERSAGVQFTPHDLRRTVRSRLSSLGVDNVVSRKVLNHALDGMDRIYDRHGYRDEKRDALQRWADELRRVLAGDERKVVPLHAQG